jgi:hypothetical protein
MWTIGQVERQRDTYIVVAGDKHEQSKTEDQPKRR